MGRRPVSVIVVGAGLAGLSAAVRLSNSGLKVTVFDARGRVGGRVWTVRDTFASGQYAEAGAEFIDDAHTEIRQLVREFGLTLSPVVRRGFSFALFDKSGGMARVISGDGAWKAIAEAAAPLVREYEAAHYRWNCVAVRDIAACSVAQWLNNIRADKTLRAIIRSLRGFFLADPEELSLLMLIDQLASDSPGRQAMFRIDGGNDRLPHKMAGELGEAVHLDSEVVAVEQDRASVRVSIQDHTGRRSVARGDYLVLALPASALRAIRIRPALPIEQAKAIAGLKYGRVTKALLQFDRRFWNSNARGRAYGTDTPVGVIWDANEGAAGQPGILTLMAGGRGSGTLRRILSHRRTQGIRARLEWLHPADAQLMRSRVITWENDPWAFGGYAVFTPEFDPILREQLGRRNRRILFAGEHISTRWQGYMNGAVETGFRAAAKVRQLMSRLS